MKRSLVTYKLGGGNDKGLRHLAISITNRKSYNMYFHLGDNDWCVMRGDNTKMYLNSSRLRVVLPTGQRKRRVVTASCGICNMHVQLLAKRGRRSREEVDAATRVTLPTGCRHVIGSAGSKLPRRSGQVKV